MTWYKDKETLDYTKPIVAVSRHGKYLLLPHRSHKGYEVVGYDWFAISSGGFTSSINYPTPEAAVISRDDSYRIYNAEIIIKELI